MTTLMKVAALEDVPENTVKSVFVQGKAVALCRVGSSVYAIEDRCSHDDGPLSQGPLKGHEIECPRHGARFDVTTGRALCMPAVTGIKVFTVKVEGSDIYLSLD